ncbi:DUF4214 domain-containing protein [Pseudomonas sp. 102515]|uniref:DUF4214 domain-containing protein n=1 Tax=Pseudomonas sp. 102515 TaxID=3071568 RepID=UPI0028020A3D|nr:DUF4214 domain-containing protein [Pseudomonas sp. 102515]MDQ7914286.1 DUF4214 domain-containing protein [Pseudomonas sp. 102515]
MAQVLNRSTSPYKESYFVQAIYADGTILRGSGTVVGANDVLTALHVIYNASHGGWATQVIVTPGALISGSTFSAPLGTYSAASWTGYSSNWDTNNDGTPSLAESGHDLALLNFDLNLANLTGNLAVTDTQQNFNGTIVGYPVRGNGLMQEQVNATYLPNESVLWVDGSLGAGASGGALVDFSQGTPTVSGVLSAGDSAYTYAIYAAMTGANLTWYQSVSAANDVMLNASSVYRPMGAGVSSGSDQDDLLLETRLAYDSSNTSFVYGYKGTDSLIMRGNFADYSMTTREGDLWVSDHYNGAHLALYDINALIFNDRTLYVMSEEQAQIARLYTVFGRTPDLAGLKSWVNAYEHGASLKAITSTFTQSQEFANHYNAVDSQGFVSQLYSAVLGRTGDSIGLANWTWALNHGMSRDDAVVAFTNSQESINRTSGSDGFIKIVSHSAWSDADTVIQSGVAFGSSYNDRIQENQLSFDAGNRAELFGYQGGDILYLEGSSTSYQRSLGSPNTLSLSNVSSGDRMLLNDINMLSFTDKNVFVLTDAQAQIARLYTVFDRAPDFDGLQNWLNANSHGMTFNSIANGFAQSQEFALRYNAVDNQGFANQLYQTVLGRDGEAAGLAHWTQQLDAGMSRGDAMINFTNSQENQLLTEGANGFIQIIGQSDWV